MLSNVADSREILLAEEGKTDYRIVVPRSANDAESLSARELAKYLKKISGAEFPCSTNKQGNCVVLACQDSLSRVPIGDTEIPNLPFDGFWIGVNDNDLYVIGANERGILYGTYALLENLGCRWLSPDFDFYEGSNEYVPSIERLTLEIETAEANKPALKYRKLYVEEGHSHTTRNLVQLVEWMSKRRFNTLVIPLDYGGSGRVKWDNWTAALTPELRGRGLWIEVGGHGYENYLNAEMEQGSLFEKHPEWFGMDENGKRDPHSRRVFCSSNPEAFQYLLKNVLSYLERHPEIDIFDFWPPDGARWCQCQECLALGEPSDRHALLVSKVSEAVRKIHPDVQFECIAYSSYLEPPKSGQVGKEVLVDFCPIRQCFEYQIDDPLSVKNAMYVKNLKAWLGSFDGDLSIYSYYRKYAWHSLPILLPHYMQHDLRFYGSLGVRGISCYSEPADWGTYELNHYVLGALAWDIEVNVDELLKEFVELRFSGAESLVLDAYRLLEKYAPTASSIPGSEKNKTAQDYDGYLHTFQDLRDRISHAQREASQEENSQPLARLASSVEYLLRDIELMRERVANGDDSQRAEKARRLMDFITERANDGVFLLPRFKVHALERKYGLSN